MAGASFLSKVDEPASPIGALLVSEAWCRERGLQLTPIRGLVLHTLHRAAQPLGAYDLLEQMEDDLSRRVTPPTVYRALEFLLDQKLIAKIESRNTFVPCMRLDDGDAAVFFICDGCGRFEAIEDRHIRRMLDREAGKLGFRIRKRIVELQGKCSSCQGKHGANRGP